MLRHGKTDVIHFLLSNCKFWLEEYGFDGYRFDGVTSMLFWNHGLGDAFTNYGMYFNGSVDDDAWVYLNLANRVIHAVKPNAVTIAEDVSGIPGCAAPVKDCGIGFDYRMAMGEPDFWFKLAEKVKDEDWQMGSIFWELTNKRAEEKVAGSFRRISDGDRQKIHTLRQVRSFRSVVVVKQRDAAENHGVHGQRLLSVRGFRSR